VEVEWRWRGGGVEVAWRWSGGGVEVEWRWRGGGVEVAWRWSGGGARRWGKGGVKCDDGRDKYKRSIAWIRNELSGRLELQR
jgi:hypothetical protein